MQTRDDGSDGRARSDFWQRAKFELRGRRRTKDGALRVDREFNIRELQHFLSFKYILSITEIYYFSIISVR